MSYDRDRTLPNQPLSFAVTSFGVAQGFTRVLCLKEIMARHRVKNKDLATYLSISTNAMSSLRNAFVMPKIGSEKWGKICTGINELSKIGEAVTPLDLIEYIPEESIPAAIGTNKTQKTVTNSSRTKDSTSYEAKSHLVAHLKRRKNVA